MFVRNLHLFFCITYSYPLQFPFKFFFLLKSVLFVLFCFCCLGPHPQLMEVPRLRVKLDLELLAYTTAMAKPDLAVSVYYTAAHGNSGSLTH